MAKEWGKVMAVSDRLLLDVADVSKRFGGVRALDSVGLRVAHGSIVGLIGPNGAGKTTFFNVITGLYPADSGIFLFDGKSYFPESVSEVTKSGLARTFQNIRLFGEMSVLENVMVGCHCRTKAGLLGAIFRFPSAKREERAIREKAQQLLAYVGLGEFANMQARNLSYGHQRRLEIARALATEPKLLALDEPAAGISPTERGRLVDLLKALDKEITLVLIEHDMAVALAVADEVIVMHDGNMFMHGSPDEIRNSAAVRDLYLGSNHE